MDDCSRSHDIDNLIRKTSDLDYEISRVKDDLQNQIWQLERRIKGLLKELREDIRVKE